MSPETISTHDKLRREAAALFAQRGYGGTSMADIAERVGVRKASLYNYYASKADLLLELLEKGIEAWEEACRPALESPGTTEARLAAYLREVVDFAERNPQTVGIVRLAATQVGGNLGRRVKVFLADHEKLSRDYLTSFFAQAVEDGEVKTVDPEELSLFWSTFIDGILINQLFATDKAKDAVAHLPRLWEFFWRGVSGHRPHTELGE